MIYPKKDKLHVLQQMLDGLVARIEELANEAEDLATQFVQRRRAHQSQDTKAGYAPLYIAYRFHKGSIELAWKERHSPRTRDGFQVVRRFHIPKGKASSLYDLEKLAAKARPWERQDVVATEIAAAAIRAEARAIQKVVRVTRERLAGIQAEEIQSNARIHLYRQKEEQRRKEAHLLAWGTPPPPDPNWLLPADDAPADVDRDFRSE